MRGGGLKLLQGRVAGNFFSERVLRCQNGAAREVVQSPPPEAFKKRLDVVLRDMV